MDLVSKNIKNLSGDKKLNKLLNTVLSAVKLYAEEQIGHIKRSAEIGLALSVRNDLDLLFQKIVEQAMSVSNADGGTLYTVSDDGQNLCFKVLQNKTMGVKMGGTSGNKIVLADVKLYIDGETPNHSNVSSYVALTGNTVNIPDVYMAEGFDFQGTRNYDSNTGYKSKSMLVIPLKNHEDEIIGVLQLLNAKDLETSKVIEFSPEYVDLIKSLASQAAVALTNTQLIQELKGLFHSFIQSIATAIDEKSPYTGGHVRRVVDLTMLLAQAVNQQQEGTFKDTYFNYDQLEELKIAAWMHDVGKITTPEYVINKATKLETIFDRLDLIETRFNLIAEITKNNYLIKKLENKDNPEILKTFDLELEEELQILKDDFEAIKMSNNTGDFMKQEQVDKIIQIAKKTYFINNQEYKYLTDNELANLCIRKGTLTDEERKTIENHANMTLKILEKLPFPKKLRNVPVYAAGHHEKLDGSGYPKGLDNKSLPIQARIMAIADIFEALTAKDRPYKKPMKLSEAIKILGFMKKDKHIDSDLYDLFVDSKVYKEYAQKELNPSQIDI